MIELVYFLQFNLAILHSFYEQNNAFVRDNPELKMARLESTEFGPEQAEERLREHLSWSFSRDSGVLENLRIFRVDYDIADLYSFYVVSRTTNAPGLIHLVGPDIIFVPGPPENFDRLMKRVGVGVKPNILDVREFAKFFLLLRVLRNGFVVDNLDSPSLLLLPQEERISEEQFSPPQYSFDEEGAHYSFWIFHHKKHGRQRLDFWEVHVSPDGETSWIRSP